MYIVTFTAHQQRNMVRTPHFFGAGDATDGGMNWVSMVSMVSKYGKHGVKISFAQMLSSIGSHGCEGGILIFFFCPHSMAPLQNQKILCKRVWYNECWYQWRIYDSIKEGKFSLATSAYSGIHSLLTHETRLLYQYSVPGSKHTSSKLLSLPRLFSHLPLLSTRILILAILILCPIE